MRKIASRDVISEKQLKHFECSEFLKPSCGFFKMDLSMLVMVLIDDSFE